MELRQTRQIPKMQNLLIFHVVFLHASLIFHATDSLPAKMHDEKTQGEFYTLLQRFVLNLVLSFLTFAHLSLYFPFNSFLKLLLTVHVVSIIKEYLSPYFGNLSAVLYHLNYWQMQNEKSGVSLI